MSCGGEGNYIKLRTNLQNVSWSTIKMWSLGGQLLQSLTIGGVL